MRWLRLCFKRIPVAATWKMPWRRGWKLGGCCTYTGERVEVGGGNRWRRKAAFALENTGLVKLTGLRTCQMGRVREVSG